MKKIFYLLAFLLLCTTSVSAQIITVKQDGTGDFTTIQAAVDSAQNGDTVLVWQGTYVENIEIISKNITLGSLTLTTGDLSYINQTVIDGNQTGSCIKTWNWNNPGKIIINGFTIKNGNGSNCGGICGGGLFIESSQIEIYNCVVRDNQIETYGGGLYIYYSDAFLSNVTIKHNHAYVEGGGLLLLNGNLTFDSVNRCNIYENYAATATDIYNNLDSIHLTVYVDTFTVQNPSAYYVLSGNIFNPPSQGNNNLEMNILHHKIEQTHQNLYVSPEGDNGNNGLTPSSPLKTISYALLKATPDSISPDTIFLANGVYSDSTNGEKLTLQMKTGLVLCGENRDSVIIDGENKYNFLLGNYGTHHYTIKNLTFQNGNGENNVYFNSGGIYEFVNHDTKIEDVNIYSCGKDYTAGIRLYCCNNSTINRVHIKGSRGGFGLSLGHSYYVSTTFDTVFIMNSVFEDNVFDPKNINSSGGDIYMYAGNDTVKYLNVLIYNSVFDSSRFTRYHYTPSIDVGSNLNVYLVNCTFSDNDVWRHRGKNISIFKPSSMHAYNSIFYNKDLDEFETYGELELYHSDIHNGIDEIEIFDDGYLYYDSSNIASDPMYDTADIIHPYSLSASSPCIDAGTMELPGFLLYHMPETDIAGNPRVYNGKIDMGAYEWNNIGIEDTDLPQKKVLKIAPNPFHNVCEIKIFTGGEVSLSVYNSYGRKVNILYSGKVSSGFHLNWDGTGASGTRLTPGIYYLLLTGNGKILGTEKVVLY